MDSPLKRQGSLQAFSLMELMVVIIIISIMVAFAIPNFTASVLRAHERDAVSQLLSLHAANLVYYGQAGGYLPGTNLDFNAINSGLNINLIPGSSKMSYNYSGFDSGGDITAFQANAIWDGGVFIIRVDQRAAATSVTLNPCCALAGSCPTLGNC